MPCAVRCIAVRCTLHFVRCTLHRVRCTLHCRALYVASQRGALHRRQQQQNLSELVELATLTGTGRPMTFAEVR
jgi:hypothetical protein